MATADQIRAYYARKVMVAARLQNETLEAALAKVPREKFVGRGPWLIPDVGDGHFSTPDGSLEFLYDNTLVAIDPSRDLNNGEPSFLAQLINAVDPAPGQHIVHVGAGVGYYTAIIAEMVGPNGRVTALEIDADLAVRAAENLSNYLQVNVVPESGTEYDTGLADGFLINAGTTGPAPLWLDNLNENGRLVLPLTSSDPVFEPKLRGPRRETGGRGAVLRILRSGGAYPANFFSLVGIFHCAGRNLTMDKKIAKALRKSDWRQVKSLHRGPCEDPGSCWLAGPDWWLSTKAA